MSHLDDARQSVIRHLYLGVPETEGAGADWVRALGSEARVRQGRGWQLAPFLESIHVGGGCASGLGPGVPAALMESLDVELEGGGEWTVEFDPGGLSAPLLDAWCTEGVNRIALRCGAVAEVRAAARLLAGAQDVRWSVDLEFGGPAAPEAVRTANLLSQELDVPHLSLVETDEPWDPDRVAREYLEIFALLEERGYRAWELTSFALPRQVPVHARSVWQGHPFLGLGPGAHSYSGEVRVWNLEPWEAYFSRIRQGDDPARGQERPGAEARALEWLWSRLRLREGVALIHLPFEAHDIRKRWVSMGWARDDPGRIRLNESGWLLLDTLAVELAARFPAEWTPPDPAAGPRQP